MKNEDVTNGKKKTGKRKRNMRWRRRRRTN